MTDPSSPIDANRARGTLEAAFRRIGARTEILGPFETGGYRLRLPRSRDATCEAVIVNTGGGMAGGDHARFGFAAQAGAEAVLTTTAAEKIYRATGAETRIDVALHLEDQARLAWLPQETILFDGARLGRTLSVEMAADAELLLAEMVVFGRLAMGERVTSGALRDRWRVRRAGGLVHAEDLAIAGDVAALLDRAAIGARARASATIVLLSTRAEERLDAVRETLGRWEDAAAAGASAWDGRLVVRALSPSPARLRDLVAATLAALRHRAVPRVWG